MSDTEEFFEIMCRGERKCGTFVSYENIGRCPKCGSEKIMLRVVRKRLQADAPAK